MTSLLSARKRAEEFAAAVDGGADPASLRPELAELVGVVGTLQREAEAPVAARPEFTAELRERLMAEAEASFSHDNILTLPPRRKGSRERRIALAASSLVLVGGSAGMAAAAQNALPGEALYPIKRGLENAQAGLATSQAAKGQDLLAQADSRLMEVRGLLDQSADLSQVPSTLDAFNRQAAEGADVLIAEFEDSREPSLIAEIRTFAADSLVELQDLAKTAPADHQDELAAAADTLMRIDERAAAVCPTCAEALPTLEMPPLFLAGNEVRAAMAAMGGAEVDNSHPVITDEGRSKPSGGRDEAPSGGDGKQPTTGGEKDGESTGGGSELPELPTSGVDTDDPGSGGDTAGEILGGATGDLLEGKGDTGASGGKTGTGGKKDGGTGGTGGTGDEVEKILPDEIDAAVETLVP